MLTVSAEVMVITEGMLASSILIVLNFSQRSDRIDLKALVSSSWRPRQKAIPAFLSRQTVHFTASRTPFSELVPLNAKCRSQLAQKPVATFAPKGPFLGLPGSPPSNLAPVFSIT